MGTITGQLGSFQQPGRWGRDANGNYTDWVFEGTKNEVSLMAAAYAQTLGLAYEVTESFGKFRLVVHFPWSTVVDPSTDYTATWEFFANHAEKDLLAATTESSNIGGLSVYQVQSIRNKLQSPPGPDDTPLVAADFQHNGETNGATALGIFNLMMAGVKSFPVNQPILRKTVITSLQFAVKASLANVGAILTTNRLSSDESIPNTLLFSLPNFSPTAGASLYSMNYGWYKTFPTIQQVALLKWSITQEWQYGLWAYTIWGAPLT